MPHGRVPRGPGVVKVRHPSAVRVRTLQLVAGSDAHWAALLERADLVSEGAVSNERGALVYRGTTSILVADDAHGGAVPPWDLRQLAQVAAKDPHFRLRAMRLAQREAQSRAPGPLDSLGMDVNIFMDPRGLRADIDVEGAVFATSRKVKSGA